MGVLQYAIKKYFVESIDQSLIEWLITEPFYYFRQPSLDQFKFSHDKYQRSVKFLQQSLVK